MHFRCPNCHQPIQVDDHAIMVVEETLESIVCPSCNSQFSLVDNLKSTATVQLGRKVEHFEIQSILGEGSYGTVYKAWDTELQRHVALKLPRVGVVTAESTEQFLHEARMASRITSPNIVSVYEVGRHERSYYIASQLIDGVTLRERLRLRQFSSREAAQLLIPLLRAIQIFHDQGIIHRDLKPGNILIDESECPYVADFGLARREDPGELTVTQSGKVIGTILYMAPEQARGDNKFLTNRADLYAMGVILFELLTGKRPFEATSSKTVLYRIKTEDVPSPRSLKSDIPRDVETICLKALRKEPEQRYESAAAMADDLQRFLDGKPIEARRVSRVEKSIKLIRRNRLASAMVAVAIVAILVAAFAVMRPPAGSVPVVIHTENASDASLRFVRYDPVLRIRHESGFEATGTAGQTVRLMPGLYRIYGWDDAGRTHEIWRTIPELPTSTSGDPRFPHHAWEVADDTVRLQAFRLFADADVKVPLVSVKGGRFEMGIPKGDNLAMRHTQEVEDFQVGVNEVSYGIFRQVMDQPMKGPSAGQRTYLQQLNERFGDRSDIPDEMPVSGYPADVAVLFCELAGGRLPTCVEWEYVATAGGKSRYSTGDEPPIEQPEDWQILAVNAATPDTTASGIRNLCASVAEYTDSRVLTYVKLYPDAFPDMPRPGVSSEELSRRLPELVEVRGAPRDWYMSSENANSLVDVRQRLIAPLPSKDGDANKTYGRIGWRMVR